MIFLRDEGTAPLKKRNVSIDVNSMSSSLEHVSTPLSSTYQSHLISMTRKQHCEENGDLWCINDNVHSETQEAGKPRDGTNLSAFVAPL